MRHNQQYNGANLDILYVLLLGISILYLLALYLIEIIEPKPATVKKEANWIIEMSWPEEIDCDIDLWVQDPLGKTVYFNNKNSETSHLERDDLGVKTDTIEVDGKTYFTKENREVWTLRGKVTGKFIVSVHSYACKEGSFDPNASNHDQIKQFMNNFMKPGQVINLPVNIKLVRINPSYNIWLERTVVIEKVWQEKNAFIVNLDDPLATVLDEPFTPIVNLKR